MGLECDARRRARKLAAEVDPKATLGAVIARDGLACYICGVETSRTAGRHDPRKTNLEHEIALANGGSHTMDNLRVACHRCNMVKGSRRDMTDTWLRIMCEGTVLACTM